MFEEKIADIFKKLGCDLVPYRLTLFGRTAVLVEGQKGVLSFSPDEVKIRLPDGLIAVRGKNLVIRQLSSTALTVSGEISGVGYDD